MLLKERPFDIITKLKEQGVLASLVKSGIISHQVLSYHAMAMRVVEKQSRTKRKYSKTFIIEETASEFSVTDRTIYKALSRMGLN